MSLLICQSVTHSIILSVFICLSSSFFFMPFNLYLYLSCYYIHLLVFTILLFFLHLFHLFLSV